MNKNLKPVLAVAGVSLALSISFSAFVGCANSSGGGSTTTLPPITTGSPTGTSTPGSDNTTQNPSGSDNGTTTQKPSTETTAPLTYQTVDETVYVTVAQVTIRSAPIISESTYLETAYLGEEFRRVKYNENWSVVLYDGEEVYISSSCLSTQKPVEPGNVGMNFTAVDKPIYVTTSEVNLRNYPSNDNNVSTIIATAVLDQELVAIGISEDGKWYKINYKSPTSGTEHVLYVSSDCVTDVDYDADFTEVNKTVYVVASSLSVRKYPSDDDSFSTKIAFLHQGDAVTVVGVNADSTWYKIQYTHTDGTVGYYYITTSAKYVSDTAPATT